MSSEPPSNQGEAVDDPAAVQRGHALRLLARDRPPEWAEICLEAALEDPHPYPRSEAAAALSEAPDDLVVPELARVLASDRRTVSQWRAERLLIRRRPEAALAVLERQLDRSDPAHQRQAVEALGRLGPAARPLLLRLSRHQLPSLRRRAVKGLAQVGGSSAVAGIAPRLEDDDSTVRLAAARAIIRLAASPELARPLSELARPLVRQISIATDPELGRELLLAAAAVGSALPPEAIDGDTVGALLERVTDRPGQRAALLSLLARGGAQELLSQLSTSRPELSVAVAVALAGQGRSPAIDERAEAPLRLIATRAAAKRPDLAENAALLERATADPDPGVRWLARRGRAGRLTQAMARLQLGRPPVEAASAVWPFGLPRPTEAQRRQPRLPLALAAINLSYNLNIGVLIRSAEAAGAREVIVVGHDAYHRLAAMGADRWVELTALPTPAALVVYARERRYQLVVLQQAPGAERFDRADYPPSPCLVVGSEGQGVPPELCAEADLLVEVPQRGEIDSINVASAAAVVTWACLVHHGWI